MADRSTWLQDYTRHSKGTDQDKAARKVFDVLENCDLLITKFQLTDTQSRAIFVVKEVPDFELIRVVVRLDEDQVFVAYNSRAATNKKWPKSWERDFETCLGIEPRMGAYIVKWCVQSHDNTDRLTQWLITKAKLKSGLVVSEPHAPTNLETSVIGNDGDSNAPDSHEGDLRADVKTEVIKPSAAEANESAVQQVQTPPRSGHGTPRQVDPFLRKMVEQAAISAVTAYYANLGYQVDSVERDNVGWDLTAVRDNRELKLEVKGLSGSDVVIELTPNEYQKMREHRDTYCVCIVSAALTELKLEIFSYVAESNQWESTDRRVLNMQEIVGARCRAM